MASSSSSRWSPLSILPPAALTPSGLLVLDDIDGEVETLVRTDVELRYGGGTGGSSCVPPPPYRRASPGTSPGTAPGTPPGTWNDRDAGLSCHATTHRLVLLRDEAHPKSKPNSSGGAKCLSLPLVRSCRPSGGPSFRSPFASYKIELSTHAFDGTFSLVFRGGGGSKDRDDVLAAIRVSIEREAWRSNERSALREAARGSNVAASRRVGVDAVLTKNEMRHRENAALADRVANAGDADVLMREAAELTGIVRKYAAALERESRAQKLKMRQDDPDGETDHDGDADKLATMLDSMGVASALSQKQSGSAYHTLLARQLADFLRRDQRLQKAGGILTLTDAYCLFNRARGTNMISPEDLLGAVDRMEGLRLGISRRKFASGVLALQDDSFDEDTMAQRLVEFAGRGRNGAVIPGGITVADVGRKLRISPLLANEQLLSAERMGRLCRDVTLEGVRFYPNAFEGGDFAAFVVSAG